MQNFKKKARYDKEINLREKCRQIKKTITMEEQVIYTSK